MLRMQLSHPFPFHNTHLAHQSSWHLAHHRPLTVSRTSSAAKCALAELHLALWTASAQAASSAEAHSDRRRQHNSQPRSERCVPAAHAPAANAAGRQAAKPDLVPGRGARGLAVAPAQRCHRPQVSTKVVFCSSLARLAPKSRAAEDACMLTPRSVRARGPYWLAAQLLCGLTTISAHGAGGGA